MVQNFKINSLKPQNTLLNTENEQTLIEYANKINTNVGELGNNLSGFLNNRVCTPITTLAGGSNWKQISCGAYTVAAVKTDGTLWIWGSNSSGQLGDNTSTQRNTPVTTFVGGTNWKQVAAGDNVTACIKTDGTLWTWGQNFYAAIGDNSSINKSTPVTTFAGGSNWKQIAASYIMTAIKTSDDLQGI